MNEFYVNRKLLEVWKEIDPHGWIEIVKDILTVYLDTVPQDFKKFVVAKNQSDLIEMQKIAHSLKSSSGNNDYIVKPIDPLVLSEKIKKLALNSTEEFAEVFLSEPSHKLASFQKSFELISVSEFGVTAILSNSTEVNEVLQITVLQKNIPELENIMARCTKSEILEKNRHKASFTFVGLTEATRKKIRTFIRQTWIQTNGRAV